MNGSLYTNPASLFSPRDAFCVPNTGNSCVERPRVPANSTRRGTHWWFTVSKIEGRMRPPIRRGPLQGEEAGALTSATGRALRARRAGAGGRARRRRRRTLLGSPTTNPYDERLHVYLVGPDDGREEAVHRLPAQLRLADRHDAPSAAGAASAAPPSGSRRRGSPPAEGDRQREANAEEAHEMVPCRRRGDRAIPSASTQCASRPPGRNGDEGVAHAARRPRSRERARSRSATGHVTRRKAASAAGQEPPLSRPSVERVKRRR